MGEEDFHSGVCSIIKWKLFLFTKEEEVEAVWVDHVSVNLRRGPSG